MTMQPEHTDLLQQLRLAFPVEPIRSEGAFADWGATYSDVVPYTQQLEGKTWEGLDRSYMVLRADALGFLSTHHLAAVLPVYLRSLIEEGVWSASADTLLLLLTKPGSEKKTGIKLPRFQPLADALTLAQRTAVATVLHAFAAMDEGGSLGSAALAALDGYWKTYLPKGP